MTPAELLSLVEHIAEGVAAEHAESVDQEARFPEESIQALRDAGALGALVPVELGGVGCDLATVVRMCTALGRRCASSGMVFAMHQIQVDCLLQVRERGPELEDYLRSVAHEQRLIGSMTSEIGTGGDLRRSIACVEPDPKGHRFRKCSPTISYVAQADDLLVTVRREKDAPEADQVLVLARQGDFVIEDLGVWNTLGMRGTCSPPATVEATVPSWQVLPTPFRILAAISMVPASHILWSAVWLGIAIDAFDRARRMMQAKVRKDPDGSTAAALRLASLATEVDVMRSQLDAAVQRQTRVMAAKDPEREIDLAATLAINDLKLSCSERVGRIVYEAIQVCGISAYRNNGEFSLGRHLRDAYSAPLMIHNDRIRSTNADLLSVYKGR
jgi:acyl-CoA dehydrogenase